MFTAKNNVITVDNFHKRNLIENTHTQMFIRRTLCIVGSSILIHAITWTDCNIAISVSVYKTEIFLDEDEMSVVLVLLMLNCWLYWIHVCECNIIIVNFHLIFDFISHSVLHRNWNKMLFTMFCLSQFWLYFNNNNKNIEMISMHMKVTYSKWRFFLFFRCSLNIFCVSQSVL